MLPQKIFSPIVLTFDVKLHSISVFPMGILNTQKIPSRVGWAHFLHHKSGNVAIFSLGVLDHLFGKVATMQVLQAYYILCKDTAFYFLLFYFINFNLRTSHLPAYKQIGVLKDRIT